MQIRVQEKEQLHYYHCRLLFFTLFPAMKVLITNDDGPLSDQYSPYIRIFVQYLLKHTDWDIYICIPNQQRSWIGKAHFANHNPTASFIYSNPDATTNEFLGPFSVPQFKRLNKLSYSIPDLETSVVPENFIEWCLIDGTPATCSDIGLNHLVHETFDVLISGPNVGRNASAPYIGSSGTVGAAIDAYITNPSVKSFALSWAYFDGVKIVDDETFEQVCAKSFEVIDYLIRNWDSEVKVYSINVPLRDLTGSKFKYCPILESTWCTIYSDAVLTPNTTTSNEDILDGHQSHTISFNWQPNFKLQRENMLREKSLTDGSCIEHGNVSVTPLSHTFKVVNKLHGEFQLNDPAQIVLTIPETEYIYGPLNRSFRKHLPNVPVSRSLPVTIDKLTFHYGDYEQLDMDQLMSNQLYHANSYIYRKAIIRKHYLSHTIHSYVVKNRESILNRAFLESFNIDVDYAEFLDDALDENWELRQELESKEKWWILKPSMSDKGQGIRIFKTIEQLQAIFDSFEEDETDDEDTETNTNKVVTSQLRHFIVQEYLHNPLLLSEAHGRKFHIRCYVTCSGDLQVFVYDRMLALFAPNKFVPPTEEYDVLDIEQLACHLTNTCLQTDDDIKSNSVIEFDALKDIPSHRREEIRTQIHEAVSELFKAAVNVDRLNFRPLKNSLETFGFDFLVDSDYQVKLLEVNAFPDFKQTGDDLKNLIDELFDDVVSICVRPMFNLPPLHHQHSKFVEVLKLKSNDW